MDFLALLITNDASRIPLSMLLVFGAAKLLGEIFERLHQPGIVGGILAGVLLGPSLLAWIQPGELLGTLAELGVMFLLFRVGLEVQSSELVRVGGTALAVATMGVALPFVMGWGILILWGHGHIEAVFVGAAMVATSVGITAQVLNRRGLIRMKSSRIILAAAVIDDVLGLLVLAGVSSMAQGRVNLLEIALIALFASTFVLVVAKWGSGMMARIFPRVQDNLLTAEAEFNVALILLFALSAMAVYAGIAAIVGAFLAGMAMAESVGQRVKLLAQGATELLVPFFLAGIGLHLDLGTFQSTATLELAALILLAACVSKFLGCGLGALRLGRLEAMRIGIGMVPRGEVGIVTAQLGLAMGAVSPHVYSVVVLMAVATTLLAPPLLNLAYRGAAEGPRQPEYRVG